MQRWGGVGWIMKEWMGHPELGWVMQGDQSCRGWVGWGRVGWVMQRWGGVGHTGVGWGRSCRDGVGWIMQWWVGWIGS